MIRFFDTYQARLRDFETVDPSGREVKIYTCGPTVYDHAHIGNFRSFVFEDLLRRLLEFKGYGVVHVMNITDVDDKTIAGAAREKRKLEDFTAVYSRAFEEDMKALNIFQANGRFEGYRLRQPRATAEIPAMIDLIRKLMERGHAYESEGSVYYRVQSFAAYGRLSKKKLESNIEGARVQVDEYEKEEGADFVLWKKAKEGEPFWDSPWGPGRPGWHIECSAMSMKYLGETFDIHAGGEDLVFPHHENEIAQSEAATGRRFVNFWLHCKHLLVDGEKMSKSRGNFYTLRDLTAKGFDPAAVRYALGAVHYRQPLNFTLESLREAGEVVKKLDECYFQCLSRFELAAGGTGGGSDEDALKDDLAGHLRSIEEALSDDLNISSALAGLSDMVTLLNRALQPPKSPAKEALNQAVDFFAQCDKLLGLDISAVRQIPPVVLERLRERHAVRSNADFKKDRSLQQKSDELRVRIENDGWHVKDARPGEISTVKYKRRRWNFAPN
jgi:cysteinyl-tRNA synthetase